MKKRNKRKLTAILAAASLSLSLLSGLIPTAKVSAATTIAVTGAQKNVVAYMPNWGMYDANMHNMNPDQIPWDKITVVNHAFFTVDSSFKIATLDAYADFQADFAHSGSGDNDKGFFGEYKYFKQKYPDKKIVVSVGGWTRGENFHAMAMTSTTRATFINSVIAFLKKYPFIDGIDIDWEYPGINRPKDSGDEYDRGCPGGPEDTHNFTLLMKEIREAYNANSMSSKMLTIAAPAGYEKIDLTEPDQYAQYLDYINVMTYDIHGAWQTKTNHQTPLYASPADPSPTSPVDEKNQYNVTSALKFFTDKYKVPKNKINIGTPFYSRGWKGVQPGPKGDGLYQASTGEYTLPNGQTNWFALKQLETTPGWTKYYDSVAHATWLYNPSLQAFLSYEDEKTMTEKADYVNANEFGGMMLWDMTGDDIDHGYPMTSLLAQKMNVGSTTPPTNSLQTASLSASAVTNGNYTLTASVPPNNTATSYKFLEGTTVIGSGTLTVGQSTATSLTQALGNKAAGTYSYTVQLSDAVGTVTSNTVSVTVPVVPPTNTLQAAKLSASSVTNGSYTLTASVPAKNTAASYKFLEGTTVIGSGSLTAGQSTATSLTQALSNKPAGTYSYTVQLSDASGSLTSNTVSVTVPVVPPTNTLQAAKLSASGVTNNSYSLTASVPAKNSATAYKFLEGTTTIASGALTAGQTSAVTLTQQLTNKAPGTYTYTVVLTDATGQSISSNIVSVTVSAPTPGILLWAPNVTYKTGDIVSYNGKNYKCVQGHTSLLGWEPANVAALWQAI